MILEAYRVTYTGKSTESWWRAYISLFNADYERVGDIYFYDDDTTTSWNDGYSNNYLMMFLPASHFSRILDLLRNEKPLHYRFNESSRKTYLSTSPEPVGEGELQP